MSLRGWLYVSAIAGIVFLVLRLFVFDVWVVPEDDLQLVASLRPNVSAGDVLLFLRASGAAPPGLALCPNPQDPEKWVAARVIGDTMETVKVGGGIVLVNDKRVPSPHACEPKFVDVKDPKSDTNYVLSCWSEGIAGFEIPTLRLQNPVDDPSPPYEAAVEADKRILVSDNRTVHWDSRDYGPVQRDLCHRIILRLWSAKGIMDDDHRFSLLW
jgi:signal peptidase I